MDDAGVRKMRGGPGSQIDAVSVGPGQKRRSTKIAVRYRGRIYLVSGEKGGVGKTTLAKCLVGILEVDGRSVFPIDADATNKDLQDVYPHARLLNLQEEDGYVNLLNCLEEAAEKQDIVISLPAAALSGASVRGAGFIEGLPVLGEAFSREIIMIWMIDDKDLSIDVLRNTHEQFPSLRIDVVGNEKFGSDFSFYERSKTKSMVEAVGSCFYRIPKLSPQVMAKLVNERFTLQGALEQFRTGEKFSLQAWIRQIKRSFTSAGYIREEDHE